MRREILCVAVGMLWLLAIGAAGAQERAAPAALRGVKTIVTLGDSITEMGGQPGGYVWLIQRYLDALYPGPGIRVVNAGISGHKSTDMAARFQRDVLDAKPDLVTISVGVNDVWHGFYDFPTSTPYPEGNGPNGVPLAVYRERVEGMITAARAHGARIALLSTTVIHEAPLNRENARLIEYNRTLQELAAKHRCLYVDLFHPFLDVIRAYQARAGRRTNLLTIDGVHMNAAGNQLMAFTILRGLGVPEEDMAAVAIADR